MKREQGYPEKNMENATLINAGNSQVDMDTPNITRNYLASLAPIVIMLRLCLYFFGSSKT